MKRFVTYSQCSHIINVLTIFPSTGRILYYIDINTDINTRFRCVRISFKTFYREIPVDMNYLYSKFESTTILFLGNERGQSRFKLKLFLNIRTSTGLSG